MAGRMTVTGTEELAAMLNRIGAEAEAVAKFALYAGADVIADAYKNAVNEIKTRPRGSGESRTEARYPTPEEKEAIRIGISTFRKSGDEVNTIIGAAQGYKDIGGKQKAIKLTANAINNGTGFMHRQPVFRKALIRATEQAQAAMREAGEQKIDELAKGG